MVHGAWHLPFMYDSLKQELNTLGYEFLCPKLKTGKRATSPPFPTNGLPEVFPC